jgi:hypothetical protein
LKLLFVSQSIQELLLFNFFIGTCTVLERILDVKLFNFLCTFRRQGHPHLLLESLKMLSNNLIKLLLPNAWVLLSLKYSKYYLVYLQYRSLFYPRAIMHANGAEPRSGRKPGARVLIPHGSLHPGKNRVDFRLRMRGKGKRGVHMSAG